ncbi:methyl-accepting chemotaxis protein [Limnochorda pilosa]|uniref:Methyl-accepting transducer domain-containing protein n=1 Tax=Limnochorda pilosa TaxID=1555112 RepID=A0A0K2SIT9_LIMPI|nr:methyl-accepting chemotaxis protein [Limnochorda pilosa]BAS27005.1 hypothetical protein LIP_1148 [Limnochorda pilosa]
MARRRTASRELGWLLVGSSLLLLVVVAGSVAVTDLLGRHTDELAGRELQLLETVQAAEARLERTRSTYLLSLPEGGEALRSYALSFGYLANFSAAENPVDWLDDLEAAAPRAGSYAGRWDRALQLSRQLQRTFTALSETLDLVRQEELITQAASQAAELAQALTGLREQVRQGAASLAEESSRLAELSRVGLIALGAFLLLLNGLLGVASLRRLKGSVRGIQADAHRSAESASRLGSWLRTMVEVSERVRSGMEEATGASEQISRGSQQAAEAVTRMSGHLAEVEQQVQQATDRLAETTRGTEAASRRIQATAAQVRSGAERLREGIESLRANLSQISELEGRLRGFREEMQEIHGIVRAISEIAERTRVLSFNASIEAARAGAHGRGFAVVAQEIKTLSETSRESAQAIGRIVNGLEAGSTELAARVAGVASEVQARAEAIGTLDDLFVSLEESFREVEGHGRSVAKLAADQDALRQEVNARLSDAAAGVQEVSAQLQETAAAMEQLHATAQRILGENRDLAQGLSEQLRLAREQEALAAMVQERLLVLDRPRERRRSRPTHSSVPSA